MGLPSGRCHRAMLNFLEPLTFDLCYLRLTTSTNHVKKYSCGAPHCVMLKRCHKQCTPNIAYMRSAVAAAQATNV